MIIVVGSIMGIAALYAFYYEFYIMKETGMEPQKQYWEACTMAFAILALSPIIHSLSCRSKMVSAFVNMFQNIWIWISALIALVLQLIAIHYAPLQTAFKTVDLNAQKWLMVAALSILPLIFMEFYKLGLKFKKKSVE